MGRAGRCVTKGKILMLKRGSVGMTPVPKQLKQCGETIENELVQKFCHETIRDRSSKQLPIEFKTGGGYLEFQTEKTGEDKLSKNVAEVRG